MFISWLCFPNASSRRRFQLFDQLRNYIQYWTQQEKVPWGGLARSRMKGRISSNNSTIWSLTHGIDEVFFHNSNFCSDSQKRSSYFGRDEIDRTTFHGRRTNREIWNDWTNPHEIHWTYALDSLQVRRPHRIIPHKLNHKFQSSKRSDGKFIKRETYSGGCCGIVSCSTQ